MPYGIHTLISFQEMIVWSDMVATIQRSQTHKTELSSNGRSGETHPVELREEKATGPRFVEKNIGTKTYLMLNSSIAFGEQSFRALMAEAEKRHKSPFLDDRDLSNFTLEPGFDFLGASLRNARLQSQAQLVNLSDTVLIGAKFLKANLTGAKLKGADVRNTDFAYATLTDVSLLGVKNLHAANFQLTRGVSKADKKLIIDAKDAKKNNIDKPINSTMFFAD